MVCCPVCLASFTSGVESPRRPKQLSCSHSICEECLLLLFSDKCPVCRTSITCSSYNIALEQGIEDWRSKKVKYNIHDSEDEVETTGPIIIDRELVKINQYLEKLEIDVSSID